MQLTNSTLASQQGHIGPSRSDCITPCLAGDSNVMNYENLTRKIRQRIFDYDDAGKGEKAGRVLRKCIARKIAQRPPEQRDELGITSGEYRGLARHNILKSDLM
jgi:hypothetical protein